MVRWLVIGCALCACGKQSKEAAPERAAEREQAIEPPAGPSREEALAHARNEAMLGPSAPTSAFDPIGGSATGSAAPPPPPPPKPTVQGDGAVATPRRPKDPFAPSDFEPQIGAITLGGKPAPKSLVQEVRGSRGALQACHDSAQEHRVEDLIGRLVLTFVLPPTGVVSRATVKTTTVKNTTLEGCVTRVLDTLQVRPAPTELLQGTVVITFVKKKR